MVGLCMDGHNNIHKNSNHFTQAYKSSMTILLQSAGLSEGYFNLYNQKATPSDTTTVN